MGAWYFKQPNGKYGRFSTVVDTVTDWNMTKDELHQNMIDRLGKYDYDVDISVLLEVKSIEQDFDIL